MLHILILQPSHIVSVQSFTILSPTTIVIRQKETVVILSPFITIVIWIDNKVVSKDCLFLGAFNGSDKKDFIYGLGNKPFSKGRNPSRKQTIWLRSGCLTRKDVGGGFDGGDI
jgi:hypothetical protein